MIPTAARLRAALQKTPSADMSRTTIVYSCCRRVCPDVLPEAAGLRAIPAAGVPGDLPDRLRQRAQLHRALRGELNNSIQIVIDCAG